jgi:hypothetical protein
MDRWRVELGKEDKYLGIVEAEDKDEAVEAAIDKFRVPASDRHKAETNGGIKSADQCRDA